NDPIYGFITIPNKLIFDIIEHPYFQRLRRISQMGLSYYVYPGAHHTRFEHAIGAMYLMQKAIEVLKAKGVEFSEDEAQALTIAILLHDIGHGPFSHTLEQSLVTSEMHENLSLLFMKELNSAFNGQLELAIQIFRGQYHRNFMNQLVSSQLDIDRLDYLKRDSFYSGVTEGNINSERIISMFNVIDDNLVVDEKGAYSVEKFIVARRLMYWMVYLHKTSLVADYVLINILKRAKELLLEGVELPCSAPLKYFLSAKSNKPFDTEALRMFSAIDDFDIIHALKNWINHPDSILSYLSRSIINRKLPKIQIQDNSFTTAQLESIKNRTIEKLHIEPEAVRYFVNSGKIENLAYNLQVGHIEIADKKGNIRDIAEASDHLNILALAKPVVKYFVYYPKE
ncbi:MAG: HD domain-containing protein, partial [Flavobacteriaceae bacterium]|nr:HD domain-containing protein [Flavobacteriaceae bacterium]